MSRLKIIISENAEIQIEQAYVYYKIISKKIAEDFKEKLDDCINSISKNPTIYKFEFENYQQAVVKKFPFVVIYAQYDDIIFIASVFNTHQNPNKKMK